MGEYLVFMDYQKSDSRKSPTLDCQGDILPDEGLKYLALKVSPYPVLHLQLGGPEPMFRVVAVFPTRPFGSLLLWSS
jgi:hypothetical protein